jgi:hypothetical protein
MTLLSSGDLILGQGSRAPGIGQQIGPRGRTTESLREWEIRRRLLGP